VNFLRFRFVMDASQRIVAPSRVSTNSREVYSASASASASASVNEPPNADR